MSDVGAPVEVPPELLDDPVALNDWLQRHYLETDDPILDTIIDSD